MRVLLVSANQEDINMVTRPLGLALVAASAQRSGHEVALIDLMRDEVPREKVAAVVKRFNPEAIGVSVRNIDDQNMIRPRFLIEQAKTVVDACRMHADAPIVLGGAGYSIFPKASLEYLGADMGVQGEGERVFVELLARLEAKRELGDLPGLYLPGREQAPPRRLSGSLNDLPWSETASWLVSTGPDPDLMLPVQTRRGCPLNCAYCSTPVIEGGIIRKCLPAKVLEAVRTYLEAGFQRLFFTDNTFNLPPSYAKDLCRAMTAEGLKPAWNCIVYPGRLDAELAGLMARAGCVSVSLGFESGSDAVLRRLNKCFTPEDAARDRRLLAEAGIRVMGFLMLGLPGETKATATESLAFVDRIKPDMVRLTLGARIYPDTPLADYAVKRGLIDPRDDLLHPRFYLEPGLEDWLLETARAWAAGRNNCLADFL